MRKIVITLLLCVACTLIACIDSDYDLSKITTDDIAIGDNESEFIMPVAKINFTSQNICNSTEEDEISLKEIYEEVDLWLPKSVVESSEYIDIDKLINSDEFGEQYLNKLIHLINEEISSVKEQRDEIALHIANTYRNRFINLLWESDIENKEAIATTLENATDEEAAELISQLILTHSDAVEEVIAEIFTVFLTKLLLVDINATIPELRISSDIRKMLLESVDDSSVENPINNLYLYGVAESEFPFEFEIIPCIPESDVYFDNITIHRGTTEIEPIRITRDEVQAILDGFTIKVPITTLRYYPRQEFTDHTKFSITLKIRKTGALKL